MIKSRILHVFFILLIVMSCENQKPNQVKNSDDYTVVKTTLEKLLLAIEQKNLKDLESLMAPDKKMELILPQTEISYTSKAFLDLHREWFKDSTWTIETNILNIEVGHPISTATTDAMYREPERDGKPYFNHIIVTYVFEKIGDKWYVIKDHASSQKKSTD